MGLTPQEQSSIAAMGLERRRLDIAEGDSEADRMLKAAHVFEITSKPSTAEEWAMRLTEIAYARGDKPPSTKVVSVNKDENGKDTPQHKKHLWLTDLETGERLKHIGPDTKYRQVFGDKNGSGAGPTAMNKYSVGDVETALVDEYLDIALESIREKDPKTYDTREKALKLLRDPITGDVNKNRVYNALTPEARMQWNESETLYTIAMRKGLDRGSVKQVRDRLGRIIKPPVQGTIPGTIPGTITDYKIKVPGWTKLLRR